MTRLEQEVASFFAVILVVDVVAFCGAILTSYESPSGYHDIAENREFGCHWSGGTSPGLTCSCHEGAQEMVITKNVLDAFNTASMSISNCNAVRIEAKAIEDLRNLRSITLTNIKHLQLEPGSMSWFGYKSDIGLEYEPAFDSSIPSLSIAIINSNLPTIQSGTFTGRINSLIFDGVTINEILPFAITNLLQTKGISIRNSNIETIKYQAFKKFSTLNLELLNVTTGVVPSRAFSDLNVIDSFLIDRCNFNTLRPGAFIVNYPINFQVTNTNVTQVDGEAFKVTTREGILFKNNNFKTVNDGAFRGLMLDSSQINRGKLLTFDSNVFGTLTRDSLTSSEDFKVRFVNMFIDEECDCKDIEHNLKESDFYAEIKCVYNGDSVTVTEFKTNMCSIVGSYLTTIIVVSVVLGVFVLAVIILGVYYRKVMLSKKYGSKNAGKKLGNMSYIVPDGRTYRETELHVIVERTDLLTTDL